MIFFVLSTGVIYFKFVTEYLGEHTLKNKGIPNI